MCDKASVTLPPLIALPEGTRRVHNRAGKYVVLNSFAAEKLKYWSIYESNDGIVMARFMKAHCKPVADFGAYTIVHINPL